MDQIRFFYSGPQIWSESNLWQQFFKKNHITPRPSEHPPVMGEKMLFQVLGSRCLTGSALLDCHVLKGFGIYMIEILGRPYCPEWKTEVLLLDVNYSV